MMLRSFNVLMDPFVEQFNPHVHRGELLACPWAPRWYSFKYPAFLITSPRVETLQGAATVTLTRCESKFVKAIRTDVFQVDGLWCEEWLGPQVLTFLVCEDVNKLFCKDFTDRISASICFSPSKYLAHIYLTLIGCRDTLCWYRKCDWLGTGRISPCYWTAKFEQR